MISLKRLSAESTVWSVKSTLPGRQGPHLRSAESTRPERATRRMQIRPAERQSGRLGLPDWRGADRRSPKSTPHGRQSPQPQARPDTRRQNGWLLRCLPLWRPNAWPAVHDFIARSSERTYADRRRHSLEGLCRGAVFMRVGVTGLLGGDRDFPRPGSGTAPGHALSWTVGAAVSAPSPPVGRWHYFRFTVWAASAGSSTGVARRSASMWTSSSGIDVANRNTH